MNKCQCIRCKNEINGEFFRGENGEICADCLRYLAVYNVLKQYDLIAEASE